MGEVLPAVQFCSNKMVLLGKCNPEFRLKFFNPSRQCDLGVTRRGGRETKIKLGFVIKAQMISPSTYSSRISTDMPLYEVPGASFDEYLEDMPRVFEAMFPDKRRSQRLNEEEWRIHMLPIDFLILSVQPVIDMRVSCKSEGMDYPAGVPRDVTKVIELEIIRWKLEGLDDMVKPSHFSLGVKGVLYPDRRGPKTRLKGRLQMSISFTLPALLSLVPENVRREVAESVLRRLTENMKERVNKSLQSDYNAFKRGKSVNLV